MTEDAKNQSDECQYVTPFTLTDAEREALEVACEYVGSAYQVEHHAATLRGLLERTK